MESPSTVNIINLHHSSLLNPLGASTNDIWHLKVELHLAARPVDLNVTIDSVFARNNELTTVELDGGLVVLSLAAGSYFGLNRVASEIWNMLSEPCRVSQIFDALANGYDVDKDALARDVIPFLQSLVDHRLVRAIYTGNPR